MPPKPKPEKVHVVSPQLDRMVELLESIDNKLTTNTQSQGEVMATLEELQAEVSQNTTAVDSASRLISGLADQLEEAMANDDPEAVQALVDQLRSNNSALAAAVAENTEVNPL